MVYADTDFFVALVKEEDWLQENAEQILEEYQDELETSLPTFIELCLIAEDYNWQLERAVTNILQIAEVDFEEKIVYQALEYIYQGLNVFDAFQAASSEGKIISSDKDLDKINIERMKREEKQE
jgi:predicted nucleic acid-binding protein